MTATERFFIKNDETPLPIINLGSFSATIKTKASGFRTGAASTASIWCAYFLDLLLSLYGI